MSQQTNFFSSIVAIYGKHLRKNIFPLARTLMSFRNPRKIFLVSLGRPLAALTYLPILIYNRSNPWGFHNIADALLRYITIVRIRVVVYAPGGRWIHLRISHFSLMIQHACSPSLPTFITHFFPGARPHK